MSQINPHCPSVVHFAPDCVVHFTPDWQSCWRANGRPKTKKEHQKVVHFAPDSVVHITPDFIVHYTPEYSQTIKALNKLNFQKGSFICKMNRSILFSFTDDDGEFPFYSLYSLNTITSYKWLIDSQINLNCWAKTSDSTLVFSKSNKLFLWNSNTNVKTSFLTLNSFTRIIGIGFNNKSNNLIFFDLNDKNNVLKLNVFNKFNDKIFSQEIRINEVEIEGIVPKIGNIKDYFVFSVQDRLYVLDFSQRNPELKLVSDKCDGFALNEDKGILYYKFISDEETNGYMIYFEGWKTVAIDNVLNEKIYNCVKSNLYTTNIDNKYNILYLICDIPYIFNGLKWQVSSEVVLYKDDELIVKLPFSKQKINDKCFEWKRVERFE